MEDDQTTLHLAEEVEKAVNQGGASYREEQLAFLVKSLPSNFTDTRLTDITVPFNFAGETGEKEIDIFQSNFSSLDIQSIRLSNITAYGCTCCLCLAVGSGTMDCDG